MAARNYSVTLQEDVVKDIDRIAELLNERYSDGRASRSFLMRKWVLEGLKRWHDEHPKGR